MAYRARAIEDASRLSESVGGPIRIRTPNNRVRSEIPHFFPQTNPTPPDESDTTGQIFFDSRIIPTPPDHSDHMHPSS
jgi:hypothetical protein